MQRKFLSGKVFDKLEEGTRDIRKTSIKCHRAASTY